VAATIPATMPPAMAKPLWIIAKIRVNALITKLAMQSI